MTRRVEKKDLSELKWGFAETKTKPKYRETEKEVSREWSEIKPEKEVFATESKSNKAFGKLD